MRRAIAFAVAAALLLLLAPGAVAAPGRASQIRGRLAAAVQKTAAAKSLVGRATAEIRETDGRDIPFYRLEERFEDHGTPKTDDRRFAPGSRADRLTNEVVTIGRRAWWRGRPARYRKAKLAPGISPVGFKDELAAFQRAVAADKNLKALGGDTFSLTAPTKAINGPEGGSGSVELVISLTEDGHLGEVQRIEEEGKEAELFIVETFDDFGRSFGIAAPPAKKIVEGPVKEVTSEAEFSDLLGPPPFGDD